jgi:hypothetical protein
MGNKHIADILRKSGSHPFRELVLHGCRIFAERASVHRQYGECDHSGALSPGIHSTRMAMARVDRPLVRPRRRRANHGVDVLLFAENAVVNGVYTVSVKLLADQLPALRGIS